MWEFAEHFGALRGNGFVDHCKLRLDSGRLRWAQQDNEHDEIVFSPFQIRCPYMGCKCSFIVTRAISNHSGGSRADLAGPFLLVRSVSLEYGLR